MTTQEAATQGTDERRLAAIRVEHASCVELRSDGSVECQVVYLLSLVDSLTAEADHHARQGSEIYLAFGDMQRQRDALANALRKVRDLFDNAMYAVQDDNGNSTLSEERHTAVAEAYNATTDVLTAALASVPVTPNADAEPLELPTQAQTNVAALASIPVNQGGEGKETAETFPSTEASEGQVVALCGYVFVPHQDPRSKPVCSRCVEEFEAQAGEPFDREGKE
jgi:hypothetical protein